MKRWLKETTRQAESQVAIGSGGNINKVFMLAGKKLGKPLTYKKLKDLCRFISRFEVEKRIRLLGLHPDRADVIVPAAEIFLQVMKWAGISKMYVPFIGLSDGLIHLMYEAARSRKSWE